MQHLLVWLLALIDAHLVRQIQFLKAENEILRSRLGLEVHTRPEERRRLLKFGLPLGGAVKHLISIVSYPTFRRWMRREGVPKPRRRRGRPRQPEEIEQLVVRMGRENAWGYSRILAELKKLNIHSLCRNTVKNILKRYHLDPGPQRGEGPGMTSSNATWPRCGPATSSRRPSGPSGAGPTASSCSSWRSAPARSGSSTSRRTPRENGWSNRRGTS